MPRSSKNTSDMFVVVVLAGVDENVVDTLPARLPIVMSGAIFMKLGLAPTMLSIFISLAKKAIFMPIGVRSAAAATHLPARAAKRELSVSIHASLTSPDDV